MNRRNFKDEIANSKTSTYKKISCTCYLEFKDENDKKCKISFKDSSGKPVPDCEYLGKMYSKYDIEFQKKDKIKYMKYDIRIRPFFKELHRDIKGNPEISKILESVGDSADAEEFLGLTLDVEALSYKNVVDVDD